MMRKLSLSSRMAAIVTVAFSLNSSALFAQGSSIRDKEGKDIQTLSGDIVWQVRLVESNRFAPNELRIKPSDCQLRQDASFDCTEPLLAAMAERAGTEELVLLRPFLIRALETSSGLTFPEGEMCSIVQIKTAMRKAVRISSSFVGAGFYAAGELLFVPKERMLAQKEARMLNNNEPAIVDSFYDVSLCQTTPSSPQVPSVYEFKPYAEFVSKPEAQVFRVWELLSRNHLLNPQAARPGFDRSYDIIRPLEE